MSSGGSNGEDSPERGPNPVERFEESFMNCLAALSKEDTLTNVDKEEIRVDVEQGIHSVIECARAMESYFLKKRMEIAGLKPELLVKDDANEGRMELSRKDELLKKNYEKIQHWQNILADMQNSGKQQQQQVMGPGGNQMNGPPMHLALSGPGPVSVGPHTPMSQGPMTPGSGGRPNTPGAGRPQTPRMSGMVYSPAMHQQQPIGSPQLGPMGGLQGPLAFLEKSASGIGMGDNR